MIITELAHNGLIKVGQDYFNSAYIGSTLIWSRFAVNSNDFLKYYYGNFDLNFRNLTYPSGDSNAVTDQFMRPSFIDDSTPWTHYFYNNYVWNSGEIQNEFYTHLVTGLYDQDLGFNFVDNPTYPSGDSNAVTDQFMRPSFIDDSTPWTHYFYNNYVWNSGEIQNEFYTHLVTGLYDQDLGFNFVDNPTYPSGDSNAVTDQFMRPSFIDDSTPWTHRYYQIELFKGDSMWNEFWYDVPEIFDQKFTLDSTNIVSFFGA